MENSPQVEFEIERGGSKIILKMNRDQELKALLDALLVSMKSSKVKDRTPSLPESDLSDELETLLAKAIPAGLEIEQIRVDASAKRVAILGYSEGYHLVEKFQQRLERTNSFRSTRVQFNRHGARGHKFELLADLVGP